MLIGPEGYRHPEDRKRRERPVDEPDDVDPNNPVDLSADDWRDIMSDPDYPDDDQQP